MCWSAVEYVLQASKTTGADRLLLLVIAHHINEKTGITWLSQQTLAAETRLSLRQVKYSLKSLEAHHELVIRHGVGRGHTSTYALPANGAEGAPFSTNGADDDHKRCNPRPEKGQMTARNGAATAPLCSVCEDVSKEVGERSITEEEEDWRQRYDALFSPSKTYAKL